MKKLVTLLLAAVMVFALAACTQQPVSQEEADAATPTPTPAPTAEPAATDAPEEEEPEEETPVAYTNQVIYGSTTESYGDFYSGWTNSAIDAYVKMLLTGYETVVWTREGVFQVDDNIAVKEWSQEENSDGSKTFTFTINEGLIYNNGDPITAMDYVGGILLHASPYMVDLEAAQRATDGVEYVGYEDYNAGDTNTFSGIRLIDEYTFSITVKAEELPYHYDLALVAVGPTPIHAIAPGATITDDGEGATIEGLTLEELQTTMLDPETGFRYVNPITAGPYQFVSFDKEARITTIKINPNFAGTYDGEKPKIETLVTKLSAEETQMDELATGAIDLIAGLSGGTQINAGLDLVDQGIAGYASYPRYGYGKIAFACDFGPTQFVEVRQAVAYCLDRNEFARTYTGGFGVLVHGNYAASMREYIENKDILDSELNQYPYSLENAAKVLDEGGWTLNADGGDYDPEVDEVRYKDVDGELMPLIIKWSSSGNSVAELLNTMLPADAAKVGMKIEETVMDFSQLLNHYYKESIDEPEYGMFNMGTGFNPVQAYWYYYSTDPAYFGGYNTNFITDEELETLALELKKIPMEDVETWDATWIEFQKRWNYLLPDIPLYSDEYHDFFNEKLENYDPDSAWGFEYEIVYANVKGF